MPEVQKGTESTCSLLIHQLTPVIVIHLLRLLESSTCAHTCASVNQKVADKFCYLGDMLSVDGDADAAMEARI